MAVQDDLKKAEAALVDPKTKSYTYNGKKYSLTELRNDLIPELKLLVKAELAEESKAEGIIFRSEKELRDAKSLVKSLERQEKANRNAFVKQRFSKITEEDLIEIADNLAAAKLRVAELEATTAPAAPRSSGADDLQDGAAAGIPRRVITPVTDKVIIPATDKVTTTKKGAGKDKKPVVAGTGPLGLTAKSRADIVKQFPQFSSSFDGGEGEQAFVDFFGQDAADLIVKAGTTDAYG